MELKKAYVQRSEWWDSQGEHTLAAYVMAQGLLREGHPDGPMMMAYHDALSLGCDRVAAMSAMALPTKEEWALWENRRQ